ncbi:hypothetical protein [Legionella micdadei]|uniref:Lipoprotein n=1 Tax=Legionella micdadei TaxID=451 RepID=A0A098GCK0_LEGMI|nr:hypothetical protein [Legionella micdadei]ARG96493.1 hypothetical protein B6N58_01675 [Legionella micdadei]ARG99243.1 hypothetical protein B6V88_01665 [Legionella micdadei]KTD27883.1 hypothetical protein Lmic_1800 [Legionella micdadei]CEG59712.1 exported protein of unknown function [Legionella micdadei]SCY79968.1 hypothetical protein SAMN02982997_02967 [Legionella micdadei]
MKWIALAPMIVLLAACGCCTSPGVLEYRSVTYTPTITTTRVVPAPEAVVVRPIYYDPVTIIDTDPIDVTTTTIDYY